MIAKLGAIALPVGLFGVSERSRRVLEIVFSMQGKGRYRVAGDESPVAAVVDVDAPDAGRTWSDFRSRHPCLPTVVISLRAEAWPGAVLLVKPVKPQSLLDALEAFSRAARKQAPETSNAEVVRNIRPSAAADKQEMPVSRSADVSTRAATAVMEEAQEDSFLGCREDIDLLDQEMLLSIYFDPGLRFLSACRRAIQLVKESGKSHQFFLASLGCPLIFLPDHGGRVVSRLPAIRLRTFCLVQLADIMNSIMPLEEVSPGLEALPRVNFEPFLWDVALWTSRGHLPEGVSLHAPFSLKCWPNFTRVRETPHAMTLAALWVRKPLTLFDTCKILAIPQRYVFAFFCAAEATGLIEWQTGQSAEAHTLPGLEARRELDQRSLRSEGAAASEAPEAEQRGLFGRILSHLLHR